MNKRILLVEDNPVSLEFLHDALKPLPISIDVADTLTSACHLAGRREHALFLCDVHLPDGDPRKIFQLLKQCQPKATIIAITAEAGPDACSSLIETGYQEVWGKPITMAALQDNVSRLCGFNDSARANDIKHELWDESAALRAVGNNTATLVALRKMFLAELPQQINIIKLAYENSDCATLKGECHKLLADCGFVGAARLTHSVEALSENPSDHDKLASMLMEAARCIGGD